jgi:hypothetical protein
VSKIRTTTAIVSAAFIALGLAGCASGVAGTAQVAPIPTTVVVTPTATATVPPPTTLTFQGSIDRHSSSYGHHSGS